MITPYAMLESKTNDGQIEVFRAAVMDELLPKWQALSGARRVRVTFTEEAGDGAPAFPLIMEIDYDDREAVIQRLVRLRKPPEKRRRKCLCRVRLRAG